MLMWLSQPILELLLFFIFLTIKSNSWLELPHKSCGQTYGRKHGQP
jgi:hypothetical protein